MNTETICQLIMFVIVAGMGFWGIRKYMKQNEEYKDVWHVDNH